MSRTLTGQAGMLTLGRSTGQVLNAVAGILIVRALAQYDYGTYRQIILLFTTLCLIGDAGFAQTLFYFIPRKRENAARYLSHALLAALVASAVWTLVLWSFSSRVERFFSNPQLGGYIVLLSSYVTLSLLATVLEAGLIALGQVATAAISIGAFEVAKFILLLAALVWDAEISWLLCAAVLAAALRLAYMLRRLSLESRLAPGPEFFGQFRYALKLWLPGLLNIAGTYAHQYVVGYFFNPLDYAVYSVACLQIPFMGHLSTSVGEVFLVRATEYRSQGRHEEVFQMWTNACRKSLLVFIPVTACLAVLARPLITALFTRRYLASVPYFVLILVGLAFSGLFQDAIFRAYAAMRPYAWFYALRVVLAIGLGILGTKFLGLWGAALSTLLAVATVNTWQLVKVADLFGVAFSRVLPWKDTGKTLLASAAAALPAAVCAQFLRTPLAALGAGLVLFGAVYSVMVLKLGLLTRSEASGLFREARAALSRFSQAGARTT